MGNAGGLHRPVLTLPARSGVGLRERKKKRTRATLIDAAAQLCVRHGYDNTTVDQIAAAADVSPRTFSRYFPTKDSVIIAVVDEVDEHIAAALATQPCGITEHEAMLRAQIEAFMPDDDNAEKAMSFNRLAMLIQIVNSSSTLRDTNFAARPRAAEQATMVATAQRMGLPVDHPAVRIVGDTWSVVFATACAGLGTEGHEPIEPQIVCDRLKATFALFEQLWSPWRSDGCPPAGAPQR